MERLLILNLGNGDLNTGLPSIIAQLWEEGTAQPMQMAGSLPANPELARLVQQWQTLYFALYDHLGWRRVSHTRSFEFDDGEDVTHISQAEFESVCQHLHTCLNQWLNSDGLGQIQRRIRTYLSPTDSIRIAIAANAPSVLQLPWHLWQILEDYPTAEIALSPAEYGRSLHPDRVTTKPDRVRILAILGNSQGIDVDYDRRILAQLPQAEIHWLVEPHSTELQERLWEQRWDLLFFAGHSSSQERGRMQINATETLTIERLKYGLQRSIANGLKLAIFNSCDGLGLAQDLADLRIPQTIVMRQPVPDRVAQEFLKTFLQTFAAGRSLYYSVREAREKLQILEGDFPCATWLPVICQNPAEPVAQWVDWYQGESTVEVLAQPHRPWRQTLFRSAISIGVCSLLGTGITLGAKSLGWLQPLELGIYDRLIQSRPIEPTDPRLLIITLTDEDVRAQRLETPSGSISDASLDRLLQILDRGQPSAIGLDIYRDFATKLPSLKAQLENNDRLITICKRPDVQHDRTGVAPSPEVPPESVGFSDFVQDYDGAVRRYLIAMDPKSTSQCQSGNALSTLLAMRYLADRQIPIEFAQTSLHLGKRQINPLEENAGGYHAQDAQGLQIMIDYRRTTQGIAQTVTLQQVLSGQLPPTAIKDRIILIGSINPSSNDFWATPFGFGFAQKQPGVFIHAQMVSQILSAVENDRPLLYPFTLPPLIILSLGTAAIGGAIALVKTRAYAWLLVGCATGVIYGGAWLALTRGVWLPVGMPLLSLTGTSLLVSVSRSMGAKSEQKY